MSVRFNVVLSDDLNREIDKAAEEIGRVSAYVCTSLYAHTRLYVHTYVCL